MSGINRMADVAKMLGVELGEEFKINLCPNVLFKFDMNGVLVQEQTKCSWHSANQRVLQELIYGSFEIVKLPWKPKYGDDYWTYMFEGYFVEHNKWVDSAWDYIALRCGCVFRTKEEAELARPQKYQELTGKEWEE